MSTHVADRSPVHPGRLRLDQVGWLGAAAFVGFLTSAVCAGILRLSRAWFLLPYVVLVAGFTAAHLRATGISAIAAARTHLLRGIAVAAGIGVLLVFNVMAQPAAGRAQSLGLVFQLLWFGVAYGAADALLLSVIPVMAVEHAVGGRDAVRAWPARFGVDCASLLASVVVATVYHLGFPEFRNASVVLPIIGNAVITSSYLFSRSPVAPVIAHVIMHVAAVLHGPASTAQLPPHY